MTVLINDDPALPLEDGAEREPDAYPALQALTEAIMTRADADYMRRRLDEAVLIMATRGWSPPIPWPPAAVDGQQAKDAQKPCLVSGTSCKHGSWCSEIYCQEQCKFVKQP